MKKIETVKWHFTQPEIGAEIVIYANHASPSIHFVKWQPRNLLDLQFDWDICVSKVIHVGPRVFEGGGGFTELSEDKEYYWMPKQEFLKLIKTPDFV